MSRIAHLVAVCLTRFDCRKVPEGLSLSKFILELGDFMFYVGIDIAKNSHEASIIDSNGKLVTGPFSFSNSVRGLEKFERIISSFLFKITIVLFVWKLQVIIGFLFILS